MNRRMYGLDRKGGVVLSVKCNRCNISQKSATCHLHRHFWCERAIKASTNLEEINRDLRAGSGLCPSRITMIYRVHTIGWVMADSVETLGN